jgi:selenoprotein W-related protein
LAEQIEAKVGLRSELIKGHGGVFEVTVNGKSIFSKKKLGRFPEPGEVEGQLEELAAS